MAEIVTSDSPGTDASNLDKQQPSYSHRVVPLVDALKSCEFFIAITVNHTTGCIASKLGQSIASQNIVTDISKLFRFYIFKFQLLMHFAINGEMFHPLKL